MQAADQVAECRDLQIPFARHQILATSSIEVAGEVLGEILAPHSLDFGYQNAANFRALAAVVPWRDVQVGYIRYSTGGELNISTRPHEKVYAVSVPWSGYAIYSQGADKTKCERGLAAIISPDWGTQLQCSSDFANIFFTVNRAALHRHLGLLLGHPPERPLRFQPRMHLDLEGRAWRALTDMLLQLDRSAPHGLDSPLVAESLEQTIMTTLLLTQAHNYSERLAAVLHAAPSRRIQAAVDLIHAEKSPVMLDVTAIARHIEVSVRALQLAFQKELGTSPSAYLRDVRLDQVRSILLSGTPETTSIAQTAGDWGFGNLGRFAAAYRRKFGEAPSETVHRR